MSSSPISKQVAGSQAIPIRRVLLSDVADLPASYSSTPGGTLFSTTPGGTRIVYEKGFLMNLRNSPSSKTPPSYDIPDALVKGFGSSAEKKYDNGFQRPRQKKQGLPPRRNSQSQRRIEEYHDDQFQIEL
ncbi:hypothetical protein NQ315_001779 [Exocentrus adspersus]|uniref:Uncharacterized protein n=1 Tax=Exocentrus adspersus TaxID=1586481 RepID=A0AAV8W9M5_9CUCU|nr:hypothetical protein NQ315_001779 [Exocentrus adspersus]